MTVVRTLDRERPFSTFSRLKHDPRKPAFEQDGDYFASDGTYMGPSEGKAAGLQAAAAATAPTVDPKVRIGAAPSNEGTLSRARQVLERTQLQPAPGAPVPPVNPAVQAARENAAALAAEGQAD